MSIRKKRYELKYMITLQDHLLLRQSLNHAMTRDRNLQNRDRYSIRSIYFDDPMDSALHEKLDGKFRRRKFRFRYYDRNSTMIKLEKKEKIGGISFKTEMVVTQGIMEQAIAKPYALDPSFSDDPLYQEFLTACRLEGLTAKVLIEYEREAWVLPFEGIRVCVDENVRAETSSLDPFRSKNLRFGILPRNQCIFEVKYERFFPNHVRRLLETRDLTQSAYSKYSMSRIRLRENYQF